MHNVVLHFSEESSGIKKNCIVVFASFIVLRYTTGNEITKPAFLFISAMIPLICYIYEIYIDVYRCRMRANLNNKMRVLEKLTKYKKVRDYKKPISELKKDLKDYKLEKKFTINFKIDKLNLKTLISTTRKKIFIYYLNTLIHPMYSVYFIIMIFALILDRCF